MMLLQRKENASSKESRKENAKNHMPLPSPLTPLPSSIHNQTIFRLRAPNQNRVLSQKFATGTKTGELLQQLG